jgi:ribosome-binding factor A
VLPDLDFREDQSLAAGERVEELLRQIHEREDE